jgi:signal transduction histidine kinase
MHTSKKYLLFGMAGILFIYMLAYMWLLIPMVDLPLKSVNEKVLIDLDAGQELLLESEEQLESKHFWNDDQVVEIDGIKTVPGRIRYPLTKSGDAYIFTILRNAKLHQIEYVFPKVISFANLQQKLPATILSFVCLITGLLILSVKQNQTLDVEIGAYSFLFVAFVVIGLQAYLLGVPYISFFGAPSLFLLIPVWVNLGLIPLSDQERPWKNLKFQVVIGLSVICALMALIEIIFLFPRGLSLNIPTYQIALLFQFIGLFASVCIIGIRLRNSRNKYEKKQLSSLLIFQLLAIFPVLLTFIPALVLDQAFLPIPIAIFSLLLYPLGYVFLFYRRGNTKYDPVVARSLQILSICLSALTIYFVLVLVIVGSGREFEILSSTTSIIPSFIVSFMVYQPLSKTVNRMFFGDIVDQDISAYIAELSIQPTRTTLKRIIDEVAELFSVERFALIVGPPSGSSGFVYQENNKTDMVGKLDTPFEIITNDQTKPGGGGTGSEIFNVADWAEVTIPIHSLEESYGTLMLSQPFGNGHLNYQEVNFLHQIADIISIAIRAIEYADLSKKFTSELLHARHTERRNVAAEIHNSPLQLISFSKHLIRSSKTDENGEAIEKSLEYLSSAETDLRRTCDELYPSTIDSGLDVMLNDLVDRFTDRGLELELECEVGNFFQLSVLKRAVIYQIATEALNNVQKHCTCKAVELKVTENAANLCLCIQDRGTEGTLKIDSNDEKTFVYQKSFGIRGMISQALSVNGEISIITSDDGTTVTLIIPKE